MSNLTVSTPVDTFMQSANQTAMQNAIGVGPISTPKVYYVETTGNDATGEVGNPAKPYLTAQAAYNAGVTAAVAFVIQAGVGSFGVGINGANFSSLCRAVNGQGIGFDSTDYGTFFSITTTPGSGVPASNLNGGNGGDVVDEFNSLLLLIDTRGQKVTANDGGDYTAGNGGNVEIWGTARIYSVDTSGGSEEFSFSGNVTGGNAGTIKAKGLAPAGSIQAFIADAGTGYGSGGNGTQNSVELDGMDIRGCSIVTSALTLGRCSYTTGLTITNDKGGNAAY